MIRPAEKLRHKMVLDGLRSLGQDAIADALEGQLAGERVEVDYVLVCNNKDKAPRVEMHVRIGPFDESAGDDE